MKQVSFKCKRKEIWGNACSYVCHWFVVYVTDCMTRTMELNALCVKLGKKPMYKPTDPYPGMRSPNFNYNVRTPGPYQRSMQQ